MIKLKNKFISFPVFHDYCLFYFILMTTFSENSDSKTIKMATSEARFRALVNATNDVIYSVTADWKVMHELDGRGFLKDAEEPTGDWMTDNIYPEDMEKVKAAIADAIKHKKIFELEHRVLRADRSPGWTFSRAVPIFDDEGEITEWFGTASDITEQKNAEEALREIRAISDQQKRVYETVTSNTPDLMYVFSLDYKFTYVNSALLTMWGKSWDNAVGKGLRENGYEEWHALMHEREIDQVRATKQPVRGEVSFPHAILGRRVYDYILTPVINEQGDVEAVAGTTRDVTERKQWEDSVASGAEQLQAINEEMAATNEEMAASNEELIATNEELAIVNQDLVIANQKIEEGQVAFRLAVNAANFGTWHIHSVTREFITDSRLKELFGYYPEESLSIEQAVAQITEEYRGYVSSKLENAIYNNGDYDVTYPVIGLHDNQLRWLRAIGNLKVDPSGTFSAFTGVVMDITEQKQDEIRKNDFIGMVSHELKTPLTSMKAYIQILLSKLKNQEDEFISGALRKANGQVTKMTSMINGFLNISRLESGKIHIDYQIFDIALLIKESEEESLATITSHTLVYEPVETTIVNADRDKIGQVIHNLISNAVKYSPQGSIINIACVTVNGVAKITVKDHGMGIKPQDIDKIFDRYYRVDGDHMFSISGFGIGLYLCAEIIERHNGKVWAESEFGEGSTFGFSLPLLAN